MSSQFVQHARQRVMFLDGAMGTSIFAHNLSVEHDYCGCENCTDILVRTRPDVIQSIHESFLAVGADAVETDSFGASRLVLAEFGLADQTYELNKRAAEVARAACDRFTTHDKPRFVIGSMGPGTKLITLGNTDWATMFESYREQARGLIDGGADALLLETCQDLLQVKCGINAILQALAERGRSHEHVPIMVSLTIETTGTMLVGSSIEAAVAALSGYPIFSLGLNCATGPTEMAEHVAYLGGHWGASAGPTANRLVSVLPNAGLPILHEGRTEYPLRPEPFVEAMLRFVDQHGVGLVGGCCGTTPEHIGLLVRSVGQRPRAAVASRAPRPAVASLYAPQEYRQESSALIIGERCNASGSKKFKQLLEAEDWDGIVSLAREQVRHDSAHVIDINVDYAGRDNARDMAEVVRRVVRQVDVPLMLDSTQLATLEAGLRHAGGKCVINSANFEDGPEKFDAVCDLARRYGAGLVIGSIDEDRQASMARTAQRKLDIARRGFERATGLHGLAPADLMFDPLVLPVSTGLESDRRSALETIDGVRAIAEHLPDSQTTVGLSNVSFGLRPAARVVLNSVFLHELRAAGLTSAIMHFSKILPRTKIDDAQWEAALDLIYDRRGKGGDPAFDPLTRFVDLFKDAHSAGPQRPTAELSLEERLQRHIIDGEKEALEQTLALAMERYPPLAIINDHLLAGMKVVGELFGSGQMQLPFVLQSAEVMKLAVAFLQPHMERVAGAAKGTIVLATVKGDVHDIGKNLVDIILSNNGYRVVNLGIKQPIADIVRAWREHNADAIGMSGLLVKSVTVMEENLRELNAQGVKAPVLLGGAALTRAYCEGHLRDQYLGQVFYGRDAFEGLRTMDHLVAGRAQELIGEIAQRASKRSAAEETIARSRAEQAQRADRFEQDKALRTAQIQTQNQAPGVAVLDQPPHTQSPGPGPAPSGISHDHSIPTPPFWGSRAVSGIDPALVEQFINKVALYRGQWQFKQGAMSEDDFLAQVRDTVEPIFRRLSADLPARGAVAPAVVYGYFPCNSDGDDLIVWDPASLGPQAPRPDAPATSNAGLRQLERFRFPRQASRQRLCISDYFLPASSGRADVLAMHCVTVGPGATQAAQELFRRGDFAEYLYVHGYCVEAAEALAELWHKRVRQELGIASDDAPRVRDLFTQKYRGSRYSFGYPACPDMSDQEALFRLLDPARIGCQLTENWQIDPEQSTSAIIVHHPKAKYFAV